MGCMLCLGVVAQAVETLATRELEGIARVEALLEREWNALPESDRIRRAEGIVKDYAQFLKKNPASVEGYILAGKFCRRVNCDAQAVEYFQAANQLSPGLPVVCQQLGNYCAESMHPAEALSYFLTAAQNDPTQGVYAYQVAETLLSYRDFFITKNLYTAAAFDAAMAEYFERAVLLEPKNRIYALRQAESVFYQQVPNWSKARVQWEALLVHATTQLEKEYASLQLAHITYEMGDLMATRLYLNTVQSPQFAEGKYALMAALGSREPLAAGVVNLKN